MHWALAPDEALVVTFDAHDGLWMVTNAGAFMNSMDYLYRPVSMTPSQARVDADGRIRLILAHDDPGYANWIDTQGFARGNLTYRHMLEGSTRGTRNRARQSERSRDGAPGRQRHRDARGTGSNDAGALRGHLPPL